MNTSIYLRPLVLDDAKVSYLWRNNPLIWKYSRFDPKTTITLSTEINWLAESLKRKDELRFAICIEESHSYIGNVQLIKINNIDAEFHLFIGDTSCWGKGIGRKATELLLNYAFQEMKLQKVNLEVHKDNSPAIAIYNRQGFKYKELAHPFFVMELKHNNYLTHKSKYEKNNYLNSK
jgi:diamine N-acetyltransferase